MLRFAFLALLLLSILAAPSVSAQDRAATPATTSVAPLPGKIDKPAPLAAPIPAAKSGGSDDCADALRRENAAHEEAAEAARTIPAPLVLPPECGGTPAPQLAK